MGFWALLWCVAFHRWHLEQREMISFGMKMFITIILVYLFIYIFLLMCIIPHPWLKGIIFIIGNQCIDSLTNLQLFDHNYFTRIYLYLQIHQINSPLHVSLDQQMRYCSWHSHAWPSIYDLLEQSDRNLYDKISKDKQHPLYSILPTVVDFSQRLRRKTFQLSLSALRTAL